LVYAAPAARLAGVKLLQTRHGQQYGAGRRAPAQLRLASCLAEWVVCVSSEGAQLSRAQGVAKRKICTIHNGIDRARFIYTGPRAGGPALMVGRLSPEKDAENLIRALAIVIRQAPAFQLQIAGDGRSMESLRELARALGLDDHVQFLGEVRDVAELLRHASMFILPSKTEGVSLTLLEAMSCGLPVIATRVGGTTEVIEEGISGVTVEAESPAKLAAAILQVYRDPEKAREMGHAASQRVAERFDIPRMIKAYQSLYLQCAGGPGEVGHLGAFNQLKARSA
jgi:glycosyltransferase involved in cell wall biosynthesis